MAAAVAGFLTGLALIVAIGAQNAFVLRQGLRREHVVPVVVVCAVSDVVLIAAGIVGLGRLVDAVPWFVDAARWGGAVFLVGYAVVAARRSLAPGAGLQSAAPRTGGPPGAPGRSRRRWGAGPTVLTALALTWLNPHVYLDTVVLLGSVAATHGEDRWWFGLGAALGSGVWFSSIGLGARYLGRWLRSPRAWQVLDTTLAVLMLALAVILVMS